MAHADCTYIYLPACLSRMIKFRLLTHTESRGEYQPLHCDI